MENVNLSFWDILFLPVSLPIKSIGWTIAYLQDEVEKENRGSEDMWSSLLELEVLRDIGKVSDTEYQMRRNRLLVQAENLPVAQLTEDEE